MKLGGGNDQKTYIDQFLSLFANINFICVKAGYWQKVLGPFDFDLLLKIQFLKIFKIIVENSLIAHSTGNFILKNIKIINELSTLSLIIFKN